MSHSIIKLNGRNVHVIDSGCDTSPKLHFVWLSQISSDFACVIGGSEDEAHEYFADAIEYVALNNDEISDLTNECLSDCNGDEEHAYAAATEGMLPLNGGAEWIDANEYGFWSPDANDIKALKVASNVMRGMHN